MAESDVRADSKPEPAPVENTPNTPPIKLMQAEAAASGAVQFSLPFDSNEITAVEIVDLDMVLVKTTGERYVLPQAALQATVSPDKTIGKFKNGLTEPLAEQLKKAGAVKPVEGGSYRIEASTIKPVPGVSDKLGFEFNVGKEGDEIKAQEQVQQLAQQVQKISKALQTASLSNSEDAAGKGAGQGPGAGPGTGKASASAASSVSTPSAPPKLNDKPKLEDYTFKIEEQPVQNKPMLVSTAQAKVSNVTQGTDKSTDFGEIEVRRMLAEKPFDVQVVANQRVAPVGPTIPVEKVSNDLKLQWLPSANKLILRWENIDGGLPPNFRVNDLDIKNQAVEINAPTTSIARIKLSWDIADDLPVMVDNKQFKLLANFVDANGQNLSYREIQFSYGDFKTSSETSAVDLLYLFARGVSYQFNGTADADNVMAGAGHDMLVGGAGDDSLSGGRGNDTLQGGQGQDVLDGGSGNDTVSYADFTQSTDTIVAQLDADSSTNKEKGAPGDSLINIENIIGSSGKDNLKGNNQSNLIQGGDGDDTINGGSGGADTLDGGAGKNTLSYEGSTLSEGVKINLLMSTNKGGDAIDDKLVFSSFVNVVGTNKADELTGDARDNLLEGKDGDDTLVGNDGNDTLKGGSGNDSLIGGAGADKLYGDGGDRNVVSYKDSSSAVQIDLSSADPQTGGDAQGDVLFDIQDVRGSVNGDVLKGDTKNNKLWGDAGNDTLSGNGGNDTLDGGDGLDTVDFEYSNGVTVKLSSVDTLAGEATDGIDTDALISIENIRGSAFSDWLMGNDQANQIEGRSGSDSLMGLDGNDTLIGGLGADTLQGGKGADWLYGEDINSTNPGAGNTVSYKNSNSSVFVYLDSNLGNTNGGDANGDKLFHIQNLIGSAYSDVLAGDQASNKLDGGDGDDTLVGGTNWGDDTFIGGLGNDTVIWYDKANQNGQTNTLNLILDPKLNDKFQSIETIDFQKDSSSSTVLLTAQGVRDIADAGDKSEITVRLSSTDSYAIGNNEIYALVKNKLTFYADRVGGQVIATVNIDQISSQPPVDTTLQEVASRNIFHSDVYKMPYLKVADTSKSVDELKPVVLLQERPLQVNASPNQLLTSTPDSESRVLMHLSLPGLPNSTKVVFSLANDSTHALPEGFGFIDGPTYQTFSNSKTSIELAVDGINISKIKVFWNAVADSVTDFSPYDFKLDVKFYNGNQLIVMPSSRLADPITFRFADYRKSTDVNSLGDDSKGNPILYLPAKGISYAINGNSTDDNISGGPGHDFIKGYAGNDSLSGGLGDDILQGGDGADTLDGGTGNNTASYIDSSTGVYIELASGLNSNSSKANYGTANGDKLLNIQNLWGSNGDDTLVGNESSNLLVGGSGDDILEGGKNADTLDGADGKDTISYEKAVAKTVNGVQYGVTVDLKTPGNNQGDDAVGDVYINIDNIKGSNFADMLRGDEKDNSLSGGLGDDTLEGGLGADTLDGGIVSNTDANNTVTYLNALEDKSGGIIKGVLVNLADASKNAGIYAQGDVYLNIKNVIGTQFGDSLTGDSQNNLLMGDAGEDTLSGAAGADTLDGGLGTDTVSYADIAPGAGISVSLKTPNTNTGEAAGDRYVSIENLMGTRNNDTLEGDAASNVIDGGGGNDVFYGSGGGDIFIAEKNSLSTVSYEKINSSVTAYLDSTQQSLNAGGASQDKYTSIVNLTGSASNENKLYGDTKDNILIGGAYNDTLIGGVGKDTLIGGSGIDLVSYENDNQGVNLSLVTGGVSGSAEGDQFASIENVDGTGFDDQITGNEASNVIRGLAGNDVLIGGGGGGSDTLDGGDGDDILKNSGSGNHTYLGGAGTNTVSYELITKGLGATIDLTKTSGNTNGDNGNEILTLIQNLVGSKFNDKLYGNQEKNNLSGGDGNDYLDGREGVDSLSGGLGNDTLVGGAGPDTLSGGDGVDTASYETANQGVTIDLTGQRPAGDAATNDALNDSFDSIEVILASTFNDTVIVGGTKTDYRYDGGMGIDTLDFSDSSSGVNVWLKYNTFESGGAASGGNAQNARFQNMENIIGTSGNDTLGGDDQDVFSNKIDAGKGDDLVKVTLGDDTLNGGDGNDTVDFSDITSQVVFDLGANKVRITVDAKFNDLNYSSFENAKGTEFNDKLTGDAGNNSLWGGVGNDTLVGGGGIDTLDGADGDDYFISDESVTTQMYGGDGSDTVDYTLSMLDKQNISVDLVTGTATSGSILNDSFTGLENFILNSGNDRFKGSTVAGTHSIVEGGFGNDTLAGGVGNDVLYGDKKDGASSSDTTLTYNDDLDGGAGDDTLFGGLGNDTLWSSAGQDVFQGESGNDVLSYAKVNMGANTTLRVDIANTTKGSGFSTGDAMGDVVGQDIETIIGSDNNDTLFYSIGRDNVTTIQGSATRSNTVDYSKLVLAPNSSSIDLYSKFAGYSKTVNTSNSWILSANVGASATFNAGNASKDRYVNINHLNGSIYNDKLDGDITNNLLFGDKGNDVLVVTNGMDTLDGGDDLDVLSFEKLSNNLNATLDASGSGSLTFNTSNTVIYKNMEGFIGGSGSDTLTGNDANNYIAGAGGNDSLSGGKGDDTLVGGTGADTFVGGDGFDTVDYSGSASNLVVNLQGTLNSSGESQNDVFSGVEKIVGSIDYVNTFIGNSNPTSTLFNEILVGGNNNDTFYGSLGQDSYYGGIGLDVLDYQMRTGFGTNSANSPRGIDISVNSFVCDVDGNAVPALSKFFIKLGYPSTTGNYNTTIALTKLTGPTYAFDTLVTNAKITNTSIGDIPTPIFYRSEGSSNAVNGVSSNTDDYAGDKFFNIETVRGTDYDDKVTLTSNSNWGFSFVSNNGKDSMYGGDGNDVLDFRKTGGTTYGNGMEGNSMVGGYGADVFIVNEADMVNGTLARNFKIIGDRENGQIDAPVFSVTNPSTTYYANFYVDELRIYANNTTANAVDLSMLKFIDQINRVEKIDISSDTVKSNFVLSADIIRGLADDGDKSAILLRLKNNVDTYKIDTSSGGYLASTPTGLVAQLNGTYTQSVTFTLNGKTAATAYIEYV